MMSFPRKLPFRREDLIFDGEVSIVHGKLAKGWADLVLCWAAVTIRNAADRLECAGERFTLERQQVDTFKHLDDRDDPRNFGFGY